MKKILIGLFLIVNTFTFAAVEMGSDCRALMRDNDNLKVSLVALTNADGPTKTFVHFKGKKLTHYIAFSEQDKVLGLSFKTGNKVSVACDDTGVISIIKK